jgi:hypothetical protein
MLHVGYKPECVFRNGTCSYTIKLEPKITQVSPLAEPILWCWGLYLDQNFSYTTI